MKNDYIVDTSFAEIVMPRSYQKRKIDELLVKVVESKSSPEELHWMTVISAHVEEIKDLNCRLQSLRTELSESYRRTSKMIKNPVLIYISYTVLLLFICIYYYYDQLFIIID